MGEGAWLERLATPLWSRVFSFILLACTGTVLAIAVWLEPSSEGHGTHLQLGLNTCSFLVWTGYPCPVCGATTTFSLWAHMRPFAGLLNQPFASMLFVMTASTFVVSALELAAPKARWSRLLTALAPFEGRLAVAFLGVMAMSWVYKIWLMG